LSLVPSVQIDSHPFFPRPFKRDIQQRSFGELPAWLKPSHHVQGARGIPTRNQPLSHLRTTAPRLNHTALLLSKDGFTVG
jgi:hypothetical protein